MSTPAVNSDIRNGRNRIASWFLRSVIAIDFVRFALSFSSRFEGTDNVGIADGIFSRLGGFRVDFLRLVVSTVVIFFALLYFLVIRRKSPEVKIDTIFCAVWLVAFLIYMIRVTAAGLLDFG